MNISNIKFWSIIILIAVRAAGSLAQSGPVLTLDSCLAMAERNYPQIAQYDLIRQSTAYSLSNARKGKLPQLSVGGQATYQSEVTSFPGGEGMGVPALSKDQYRLYGELVQPLTGLAIINHQKKIIKLEGEINEADLESKLYSIKQRVSDLFFGILLIQGQLKQNQLTQTDLQAGLSQIEAAVKYGTALKSSADILQAQLIRIEQRIIEQEATREGYLEMLGLFLGLELNPGIVLVPPDSFEVGDEIDRPELSLLNSKMQAITLQSDLIDKTNLPQFSLFFQGGLGRPALNLLSNDFESYYLGGLRFSWNLANYYTTKDRKQILSANKEILQTEMETFLFNTRLTLSNQNVQIAKAAKLIEKDKEIITLRDKIVNTAQGQLENGVITSYEYRAAVIDADEARQHLMLHQIELLKLKNDYKLTSGN